MERATNTIARRSGSSDCRLILSAPTNLVRVIVHRDDFPAGDSTFGTLQLVHLDLLGNERILASMGMAGGTSRHLRTGQLIPISGLVYSLGWHYDDLDQPIPHTLSGSVIGRIVSNRQITRRVEVECDFIVREIPLQHHSVAVVSTGGGVGFTNASGDITWTDTASGSNRAVYVVGGVVRSTGVTTASCTYDSVSMTKIDSQAADIDGISTAGIAEMYRLVAPNTTAGATVRLTLNGSGNYGAFGDLNLSGVDQTTPENTPVKNVGTDNISLAATTPSNGLLLTAALINSSSTDPAASHTEFFDAYGLDSFGDFYYWGASQYTSAAGAQTLEVTNITEEGAGSDKWAMIIAPVRAAAGAINADSPTVLLDFTPVAPTVSKAPAQPTVAVDLLPIAATTTKAATSGQGLLDITPIAATGTHTVTAGLGAVDFLAIAATTQFNAAAGLALVDFVAAALQEGQTHQLSPVQLDLTSVSPATTKITTLSPALLDLAALSPTTTKSVLSGQALLDLLALPPTTSFVASSGIALLDLLSALPSSSKEALQGIGLLDFSAPLLVEPAAALPVTWIKGNLRLSPKITGHLRTYL
jgi:hypothetical protein